MNCLSELLATRRIPTDYLSRRTEAVEVDCEIRAEQSVEQVKESSEINRSITD